MKIRISTILMGIVVLAALAWSDWLKLGIGPDSKAVLPVICILGFMFCMIFCKHSMREMRRNMKFAYNIGFVIIVCFLIIFIYTLIAFPAQSIKNTLTVSYSILGILLIYPLGCYLMIKEDEEVIFKFMNAMACIWYIMVLMQKILYEISGTIILSGLYSDEDVLIRSSGIRIGLLIYGNIMLVYNFYKLYTGTAKSKIFTAFMVILGCYEVVAIQQTRMYTIILAVCLLLIVIFDRNTKAKFIRKILIFVLVIIAISQTDVVYNFFASFSESGSLGVSTTNRLYAFNYYWNYWLEHPLFGMGFASEGAYYSTVHGSLGTAYQSDTGFIGQLSRLGLFIIPMYVVPVVRMCQITLKLKRKQATDWVLYFCILAFILGTSITLIIFSTHKTNMLYPVAIVLFEYRYYKEFKRQTDIYQEG